MGRYITYLLALSLLLRIFVNSARLSKPHTPFGASQAAIALQRRRERRPEGARGRSDEEAGVIYDQYGKIPRLERAFEVVSGSSPMAVCAVPGEGVVVAWAEMGNNNNKYEEQAKSPLLVEAETLQRVIDFSPYGFRLGWVGLPGDCAVAVRALQRRLISSSSALLPMPGAGPEHAAEELASVLYDATIGKDGYRPFASHFFLLSTSEARVWEVDASGYVQEVRAAVRGRGQATARPALEEAVCTGPLSIALESASSGQGNIELVRRIVCEHVDKMARAGTSDATAATTHSVFVAADRGLI